MREWRCHPFLMCSISISLWLFSLFFLPSHCTDASWLPPFLPFALSHTHPSLFSLRLGVFMAFCCLFASPPFFVPGFCTPFSVAVHFFLFAVCGSWSPFPSLTDPFFNLCCVYMCVCVYTFCCHDPRLPQHIWRIN